MRLRTIECKESNRDGFKLGLAAAVLLSLAHVASNLLSGCMCTGFMEELERSSSTKLKIWFACLIFSWYVLTVFQFSSLLIVYSSESKSKKKNSSEIEPINEARSYFIMIIIFFFKSKLLY